ncbi:Bifunctional transcriptional activator/DNA repair enzyme Ada [Marinomonas spartinae]|uniref:methylated-DNA--[protein]-cysteine S-methyltransferase n=1 Tax=Marinomonas spartinae TaxID=1792290 RepID=A0A1A8TPX5_9GAMM|nr:methylated-DNA--[protein]-cysteine S-methyltransferase [Marinomonas spartinae]SBS36318.1 Bifunctional transcriptional activator/DNA repair enzyme Ada [Marinomonas spartinae]
MTIKEEQLFYVIEQTFLGYCLLVASDKGLCNVSFADDMSALQQELRLTMPRAVLKNVGQYKEGSVIEPYSAWFDCLLDYFSEKGNLRDSSIQYLPLDLQGTVFQRQVWQALQTIPYGETQTYSELAERVGRPNAIRAVANACGANRLAVLIPCHRIVRKGGGLGGYRWGIERKKQLLNRELSCV